ncbi:MAG TPA: GrpB family protein [Anaerolineaceae bacterium]
MGRHVEVVPYHSDWPKRFAMEAAELSAIFGERLLSIHHFGSTSIPGTSAKPIIDILVIVKDINTVDTLNPRLLKMGYSAIGEYGIPGRRFFYKGTHELRSHHLHVYQAGNPHILRHLAFRDFMRTHPLHAQAYSLLKESLASQFPEDMESYIAGKSDFIKEHEKRALEWYWKRDK